MDREKLTALVTGVQNGDEAAASEMYSTFQEDIYYYIFKTVNDRELAEDLTQDTFMEILQSIGSLQEPAAFVTWSRQIAYRRCTAYFKKRHDFLVDEDEDGYSVFDTIPEERTEFIPDEALDKEDLKKTIYQILNDLPEEQRSALMMRYFDELPVSEIAKIQNVSEGTVKSRLNYGRKAVGKSVEEYEKKSGVKLRCTGVIPLLLWLLRENRLANGQSLTTGVARTTVATTAATTAVTATKSVAVALWTKIAAGVVAASLVVGGVALHLAPCNHKGHITSVEEPQEEGVVQITDTCSECGWTETRAELIFMDKPIFMARQADWVFRYISDESYQKVSEYVASVQRESAGDVVCTPVGALYYYTEDLYSNGERRAVKNCLVMIFHVDNGIVPGGWYTYVAPTNPVVIKSVKVDGEYSHFSVMPVTDYNKGHDHMAKPTDIYYHEEVYTWWQSLLGDYVKPILFEHEGKRYTGHPTLENCIETLEANLIKNGYEHLVVSEELAEYISPY